MKTRSLMLLAMLLAMSAPAFGQFIEIPISVKIVLDPNSGDRPKNGADPIKDELFYTAARKANEWMASYSRGYRFRIAEIKDIGGPLQDGSSGPSKWFGMNLQTDPNWSAFQNDTMSDKNYLLCTDKVNFYVTTDTNWNTGGACPIPGNKNDEGFMACWGYVNDGPWWIVHETGHFFGLYHTHDDTCGNVGTLADNPSWSSSDIFNAAQKANCMKFNSLSRGAQQRLVDDTYYNVLSYHEAANKDTLENHMTELQLDKHADTANSLRRKFVSGQTHFVSLTGSNSGDGNSGDPYRTILKAVTVAGTTAGDNILLIRAGNYNEKLTITSPVTLRTDRGSIVTIGQE